MTSLVLWVALSVVPTQRQCNATVFGTPGDKLAGGNAIALGRPVSDRDIGVAHRWLPIGSLVVVHLPRTGRTVWASVIDRGPYGKRDSSGWYNDAPRFWEDNEDRGGNWLSCVDLTPRAARLLGHGFGREPVRISHWGGRRSGRLY